MTTPAQLRVAPAAPELARVRATIAELAAITSSEGLLRVANFGLAILIARQYTPVALGVYATAVAASTCAVSLADGGLQLSTIHRIGTDPFRTNSVLSQVLTAKLLLVPLAALGTLAILVFSRSSPVFGTICALVFVRTLLQSFSQMNFAVLKGLRQVSPIAAIQYLHVCLIAAALVAAVRWQFTLTAVLAVLVGCQAAEFAGSAYSLRRRRVRLRRAALSECVALVRDSLPNGVTAIIATVVLRSDLLLLAAFVTAQEVGRFAAAQLVIVAMYLGSWLLGSLLLPQFTPLRNSLAELNALVSRWARILIFLALPTTLALDWGAPFAVRALFGATYQESARFLAVLLLATPFIWLNSLYLHRAIAVESRRIHVRAYAFVTAVAIPVCALCAWKYGAMGVSSIVVAREISLFAVLFALTEVRP